MQRLFIGVASLWFRMDLQTWQLLQTSQQLDQQQPLETLVIVNLRRLLQLQLALAGTASLQRRFPPQRTLPAQ